MNQDHLKALFTRQERLRGHECDGVRLSTDGHILVASDIVPISEDPKDVSTISKMREYWRNWQAVDWPEVYPSASVSRLGEDSFTRYVRGFGATAINEAYFRTLHGSGARWYWSGSINDPLLVRVNGAVIAGVMPIRLDRTGPGEELADSPGDDLIFERFADAGNGYYLQGDKVLLNEISQLEKDLASAEDKLADMQSEVDDLEEELSEKRAKLAKRRQPVLKAS